VEQDSQHRTDLRAAFKNPMVFMNIEEPADVWKPGAKSVLQAECAMRQMSSRPGQKVNHRPATPSTLLNARSTRGHLFLCQARHLNLLNPEGFASTDRSC